MNPGKWAFLAGLALAAIVGLFLRDNVTPWAVAGLGLVVGFLNVKGTEVRTFLIASTALIVALMSIQAQPYNPIWLTAVVLYEKVFITHAVLVVSLMAFFRTAKD
jgi:hypothetical protein